MLIMFNFDTAGWLIINLYRLSILGAVVYGIEPMDTKMGCVLDSELHF